jgi:flagellar motor switch protein FliN/FliY
MADILSQDELDALLSQMKNSDDEEDAEEIQESREAVASSESKAAVVPNNNVDMILNLPVKICAELGRARVSIAEILSFCQGSVVELDNVAGEAINLTINSRVVAVGEAVVVNENFGLRISEVDSVRSRIAKL